MPRPSEAPAPDEDLDELLRTLAVGAVLVVGERGGEPRIAPPEDEARIELPREPHDAVVVRDLGAASPLAMAEAAAHALRPGGRLVLVAPTPRVGWQGARTQLFGLFRRRRRVPLEELCEALAIAGFGDVQARELDTATGLSVAWGDRR